MEGHAPAGDEAQRARLKALLSSYYGGGAEASASGSGVASAGSGRPGTNPAHPNQRGPPGHNVGPPPPSIDSTAFNADQHIAQVLRTYPLEKLMVEHRNMAREIKNLDSDMQQLVYENYNKFISATDTIRSMKSNVDSMGVSMDDLKTIMEQVSEKSGAVTSKLAHRRESMEELHRVQQLLRKLQAVFDLSRKMRAALEEDALDAAVSFYAEAQPLLKRWGGRGTFRQIATESDAVAKEIAVLLKRRLVERKDSTDAEAAVLLLRKLGEPDDTLQDRYLVGRTARITKMLQEAAAVVDAMAAAAAEAPVGTPAGAAAVLPASSTSTVTSSVESPASWGFTTLAASQVSAVASSQQTAAAAAAAASTGGASAGTCLMAPSIKAFVKALDEKFINHMTETVVNVARFFLPDVAPGESNVKRRPLVAICATLVDEYFSTATRAFADVAAVASHRAARVSEAAANLSSFPMEGAAVSFSNDWGADAIAQGLSALVADVGLLAPHLPELMLAERAQQLVGSAVGAHMGGCFRSLTGRVMAVVGRLSEALGEQAGSVSRGGASPAESGSSDLLRRVFAHATLVLKAGLSALMQGLRSYENHSKLLAPWHDEWVDVLQGQLSGLFTGLLSALLEQGRLGYDGSDLMRMALEGNGTSGNSAWGVSPKLSSNNVTPCLFSISGQHHSRLELGSTPKTVEPPKSGLVLTLAKLCTFLEQTLVPWAMETLAATFSGGGGGRGGDQPPAFVPGQLSRRLGAASSALLASYVELQGRQLSLMVRRSVASTQWLNHKEPRGPRPVCDLMLETISTAEAEVLQLMDDTRAGRNADDAQAKGRSAAANSSAFDHGALEAVGHVERNVAKLFQGKVKIFGAVAFTSPTILSAIIGVGLKSLVECVRLQTLGRAGLQQLQLDMHYLRPSLRGFTGVRGAAVVDSLLDEVVGAAQERAVEGVLLEVAVLERISKASGDGTA